MATLRISIVRKGVPTAFGSNEPLSLQSCRQNTVIPAEKMAYPAIRRPICDEWIA